MKVLYISGFYPEIGGPFSALKALLFDLVKKDVKIKVLSPLPADYSSKKMDFAKSLPFEVKYLKEILSRNILPSFSLKFLNGIKKESKDCDLIHLNGIFDFYSIIVSFMDKPYVLSPRGSFMENAYNSGKLKKRFFMRLFGNRILGKANRIHLMTQEEKEHFLRQYPEYENKISLVPNGLDIYKVATTMEVNDLAKKMPDLKNKKIILFLGRIHWIKGLDLLLPAFARVFSENKDYHLLICGKDEGDGFFLKMKDLSKKLKIENSVTFTGLLEGKYKIAVISLADLLVLPSYSENFGMVVLEAMAYGCPVVVSDKVGIAREIKQNNAGVIVETNVESVYNGIKNLLFDENLRRKYSENGKRMAEKYYDINKVSEQMIKMYQEVLNDA